MSLNLIILVIVLFAFILASIEDIKKREVYDYINYSFAFLVLCVAIFDSIMNSSLVPVKYVGFGMLVGFAVGSILYYIGIWGGGDAKFLIGFSASVYYLMDFITQDSYFYNLYEVLGSMFTDFFVTMLSLVLKIVIAFNVVLLLIIIIRMFMIKRRSEFKDLFLLFAILTFMLLGLYLNYNGFTLVLLGFLSFLLIFFADDEIFNSVYFVTKKKVLELKEGDKLDESISEGKLNIPLVEAKVGLTKENITDIKIEIKKDYEIRVRQVIPYGYLVALNYIIYIFKIITLDKLNLAILGFVLKFIFFSFIVGGIIAILILTYCYIVNFKKIKYSLQRTEKLILAVVFLVGMLLGLVNHIFLVSVLFIPIYYFIKVSKQLEELMFVKKKHIDKVTLGDWIVQDIKAGDKLIYESTDFKLGVDEKQLEKIRKLSKKFISLKEIYVKDGLAFLPPLFIGFLIMLFI